MNTKLIGAVGIGSTAVIGGIAAYVLLGNNIIKNSPMSADQVAGYSTHTAMEFYERAGNYEVATAGIMSVPAAEADGDAALKMIGAKMESDATFDFDTNLFSKLEEAYKNAGAGGTTTSSNWTGGNFDSSKGAFSFNGKSYANGKYIERCGSNGAYWTYDPFYDISSQWGTFYSPNEDGECNDQDMINKFYEVEDESGNFYTFRLAQINDVTYTFDDHHEEIISHTIFGFKDHTANKDISIDTKFQAYEEGYKMENEVNSHNVLLDSENVELAFVTEFEYSGEKDEDGNGLYNQSNEFRAYSNGVNFGVFRYDIGYDEDLSEALASELDVKLTVQNSAGEDGAVVSISIKLDGSTLSAKALNITIGSTTVGNDGVEKALYNLFSDIVTTDGFTFPTL